MNEFIMILEGMASTQFQFSQAPVPERKTKWRSTATAPNSIRLKRKKTHKREYIHMFAFIREEERVAVAHNNISLAISPL